MTQAPRHLPSCAVFPAASGGHVLDVVGWMYLAPDGKVIIRSQFRKFGIKVAELVATMRPNQMEERRAA